MKKITGVFVCFSFVALLVSCGTAATANASNLTGAIGTDPLSFTAVANSAFGTSDINCVAYGNGKFIAGGNDGKISYSSDGITWTPVTSNVLGSIQINSITYGADKFVAVGEDGKIAYSTDGINWTLVIESPFVFAYEGDFYGAPVNVIIYGNGKFIAGGSNEDGLCHLVWSADGVTWDSISGSEIPFPFSFSPVTAFAYDGVGNYLAISRNGMGQESPVVYSRDAIIWTELGSGPYSKKTGAAYGAGKFVFVIDHIIAYTQDVTNVGVANGFSGRNAPNSIFGNSAITCIVYGGGMFIAGGTDGKMAHSSDGLTWTSLADSRFGTTQINGIAYGNGKFVAVGNDGKIVYSN